jgi:hypothetical protein
MTRNTAHEPAGKPTGGQFAKTTHSEPSVELTASDLAEQERMHEHTRPLTVGDVESLRKIHGTDWAATNGFYNIQMPKVFDAAYGKAATTPEGRLELAQRAKADDLAAISGVPSRDILGYLESAKDLEPGTDEWRAKVQQWTDILRIPYGSMLFIDEKIRTATGEPNRDELVAQRRELDARIDALDINAAAAGLRTRFPSAATIDATTTGEGDGSLRVAIYAADGATLWSGDPDDEDDPLELEGLNLVPDKYAAETSPLRHCTTDNDESWIRRYDLDKMSTLTAEQIAGS